MALFYLRLVACLNQWYTTTFYWLTAYSYFTLPPSSVAYPYGTLLPSADNLPIPMVHYYLLLTPYLSLWYSTTLYWPTAYTYGTLLSYACPLPIALVHYYLLLATAYPYGILLPSTGSCLFLCYSFIFYWL